MEPDTSPAVSYAARGIRSYARNGQTGPGGRLPAERVLAEDLKVSRTTLRAALRAVEASGEIVSRAQSGWYVTHPSTVADTSVRLESFTEIAQKRGFTPSARVISFTVRAAILDESERLGIPPAAPVLELVRLRMLDDVPTCIEVDILPQKWCGELKGESFEEASLYERMRTVCGVEVERTTCVIRAHEADDDAAKSLNLEPGNALLELNSTGFTRDGTAVLISIIDYRGDAYRFVAELSRQAGPPIDHDH
jgi:GntR family transcriptional regulator